MAESISSSLAKRNTEESDTGLVGGGVGGVWQPTRAKLRTMRTERFMRLTKRNAPLLFAQAQHFASTSNIVIVNLPELFCA